MVLWFAGESRQIPAFTAACFDSNWMAWFTSLASNTPNPPNCFFVSAYGPSVMDTLLAEPEIDNAPAKYEKTVRLVDLADVADGVGLAVAAEIREALCESVSFP
jgi:hypothetical protein